jgi:hypothetical protein
VNSTTSTRESSAQLSFDESVHDLVHASYDADGQHIQPKVIADASGVPLRRLYEYADALRPVNLPAEELARVTLAAGPNYIVLDHIERMTGRVAFVLPRIVGAGDVLTLSGRSAQRFGKFLSSIATSDADGTWTETELAKAEQQRDLLFAAVSATLARAALKVQAERGARR